MMRKLYQQMVMDKNQIKGDGVSTGRVFQARNLVQIGGIKREKKADKEMAVAE